MKQYEVANSKSGTVLGIYYAESEDEAIETACRDAGYNSRADAEELMGGECELIAYETVKY